MKGIEKQSDSTSSPGVKNTQRKNKAYRVISADWRKTGRAHGRKFNKSIIFYLTR